MIDASRGSVLRRLRHAAGALLVVGLLAQAAPLPVAAGPEQTKKELEAARKRVDALQGELEEARAAVESAEQKLHEITVRLAEATSQAEALAAAITQTKDEIQGTDRRIENLQGDLDERARSAYIAGPAAALELVLGATSLTDLSDRLTFLEVLNRRDSQLAAGLEVEREQLSLKREDLHRYLEQQQKVLEQLAADEAEWEAQLAAYRDAADSYTQKIDAAKEAVEKLEEKYQRELLAQIRAQRQAAQSFAPTGSSGPPPSADGPFYWCPVDAPRSYIDDFGAPRVGHTHQGNDIFAAEGTPIRAPFSGTAEEGYDGLGGVIVHVYSDDGSGDYVYNAHLSRHAGVDGQHVEPGDLIGYVGNTGNAVSTPPHDHFEYHPGGGSAVSPYVYLNEVCGTNGSG